MTIRYEKDGHVATITIDNGKVNAFTPEMHKQLHDIMQEFMADRSVHVGILTGAGTKAFCAGDDIKTPNGVQMEHYKPIVGAINGPALGMGAIYMLNLTDIRVAAPHAFIGLPEIAYGMAGAGGSTQLAKHVPPAVAHWMVLLGERMPAEDCLKYALYNEVKPAEDVLPRARELAEKIAALPPISVRVEMEVTKKAMDLPKADALSLSAHLYRLQRAAFWASGEYGGTPLGEE